MTTGSLKIHSENILPIIKKWLYSDRDIFIRELVSNACDAVQKVKILRERENYACQDEEFRIDLKIDETAKTLTFTDTGIGMDHEEVEKYIAQLAFSGAEDFVKKYETQNEKEQIIGHFGLGFYSAFMVSTHVDIDTKSYKENSEPVHWTSDGSTEYTIDQGKRAERGTEITLHIDEENKEFLDANRVREILNRYCAYLPVPIYLNDSKVNDHEPLWLKNPSDCSDEDYLAFYRHLYPMEQEPLFWIHLNVDYPFHLQGILYFPKIKQNFETKTDNIRLFCNRVFVTDHCKDVIPEYLTMLQGCIDSPDIPLNVSRSALQMDRTVRQLSSHISKKVSDRLNALYKADKEKFIKCWEDLEIILKLGVIQDDKFYERVKDCLIWKNLKDEWTTLEEYLERNTSHKEKIFYHTGEDENSQFVKLYMDKGIEVLEANCPVDSHLMSYLEGKMAPNKFTRIDGELSDAILDASKENTLLDQDGKTEAQKMSSFIKDLLGEENVEVQAKSLASSELPGFILIDEQTRRMRDYMRLANRGALDFMNQMPLKFVVNTNSELIRNLEKISQKDAELAKEIIKQVYDLAKLSQRELEAKDINLFGSKQVSLLEKLASKVLG